MSRLVETGRAGRCVQVDTSEVGTVGGPAGDFGPDGRVVDHWTMHHTEYPDSRVQATVVATGGETDPMYMVVVTSTDRGLVTDLTRAGLPVDMGISVDAVVVLPNRVQTDMGARQVMRRLMQCAADDQVPIVLGDLGFDRKAWQYVSMGIVAGLTSAPEAG